MSKWTNPTDDAFVFAAFEYSSETNTSERVEYKFGPGKTNFVPDAYDRLIPSHVPALVPFVEKVEPTPVPVQSAKK